MASCVPCSISEKPKPHLEELDDDVRFFKELLRFRTISAEGPTTGAYAACVEFLKAECDRIGLQTQVVSPIAGKPVLVASLRGTEPELPALLLNSHYDVVPVFPEHWTVEAFDAVEVDGRIYGRGAQDMKCVCAQYLVALRRLKAQGRLPFRRTVHLTFVPDEEIGGVQGMGAFLQTETYKALCPIGLALDEGLANVDDKFTVFYGERAPMWVIVTANGPTGHGSRFIANTAVEKLVELSGKALAFRKAQEEELGHTGGCAHCNAKKLGDVTTLNITMLSAGVSADGAAPI